MIFTHPPCRRIDSFEDIEEKANETYTPKVITFVIAVVLGVLGLIGRLEPSIPLIGPYNFWFVFVGWLLLIVGLLIKDI